MFHHWQGGELVALKRFDPTDSIVLAADSWLVIDGSALALDLHRARFFAAIADRLEDRAAFWDRAIATIPPNGEWFPRVELRVQGSTVFAVFLLRASPARSRSVRLATHSGFDPRAYPQIKGPNTAALLRIRTEAQARGADEAVILSPQGFIVEGAYSAILWWRGTVLCAAAPELARVDSVTARCIIGLAGALGVEVHYESATPAQLEGCEIWAVSALQGIRIVTEWSDGPNPAELPGRLASWRRSLDRLRQRIF